jgi:hypothetical protein
MDFSRNCETVRYLCIFFKFTDKFPFSIPTNVNYRKTRVIVHKYVYCNTYVTIMAPEEYYMC